MHVLLLDADRFKLVNDNEGHQVGDDVLRAAAARLRAVVGDAGSLARFGGDEFVIVLPGVGSREDARLVAEKVRQAVCQDLDVDGHVLEPAISIGVALARPDDTVKRLLKRADRALLLAKESGKNRTADDADL